MQAVFQSQPLDPVDPDVDGALKRVARAAFADGFRAARTSARATEDRLQRRHAWFEWFRNLGEEPSRIGPEDLVLGWGHIAIGGPRGVLP